MVRWVGEQMSGERGGRKGGMNTQVDKCRTFRKLGIG